MKQAIKELIKSFPQTYSEQLEINLRNGKSSEIFKWFLASILFGKPIRESSAIKTYQTFEKNKVLAVEKILETGWQGLVDILDAGSYTRYDFSTADKLLEVMKNLKVWYNGDLIKLYKQSTSESELVDRLKSLGKGIGDITIQIFLRELRDIWKVNPLPSRFAIIAANNLGLIKSRNPVDVLKELGNLWNKNKIKGKSFINFETALLRLGKDYCRKNKCDICRLEKYCKK